MPFSQVAIANMALFRIGARGTIVSITDNSPNAVKVLAVWDMVFQEVLSERDWKFAKTRVQLQQISIQPVGGYLFAYALPADFLRLVRPREIPEEQRIVNADAIGWSWGGYGWGWFRHRDLPVWPRAAHPYIVETIQTGNNSTSYTTNLLTNYNSNCGPPIVLNYIRLITDYTQLMPGFVNALADRLAAELAIPVTEDKQKAESRMEMYWQDLNSAQAQLEVDDYLQDEAGSNTWVTAGRGFGRR